MGSITISRARLLALAALGAFATLVPTASADTALPVWTCRASAAYVELDPLLGPQRVEPVLANGFPNRLTPDREQCAGDATGVQDTNIPGGAGQPLVTLNAASASTTITPAIGAARDQTVAADAAIVGGTQITVGALNIAATAIEAAADASCVAGAPVLTGSSQILSLTINGQTIAIPNDSNPVDLPLLPLVRVRFNQQLPVGTAGSPDQELTVRAAEIELLPNALPGVQPLLRVVLGEAKVDRHGAVCAPAPPPPPCPAGSIAQDPNANPLVCVATVTAPCPAGSTADPAQGGACVIIRDVARPCGTGTAANPAGTCVATPTACPASTVRDPATNSCVLIVERPCPAGATPDPTTRVCVVQTVTGSSDRENGRIGSPTGARATCGRVEMHFVRGGRRALTNTIGTRVVTRGRLMSCGSRPRPIVGARIDVIHVLPDGRRLRKTGLRSRGDGRLTLILPNDLRTRRIEYAYRPDLTTTRVSTRVILRLTVRNRQGAVIR
jgi:hypothetical protein